jgi:hypothetical protein
MSIITDYGLDSPARRLPLLLLALDDKKGEKEMDVLHLQKVIRYFEYLLQRNDIEFSNFNLGAVSYELQESLEALEEFGLIERIDHALQLSPLGGEASKELKLGFSNADLQKLSFAKIQLNDLTSDEVMFFMYNLLPASRENSTEIKRLDKKKDVLVDSLFKKGRINSITAAKWLGITEQRFLTSAQKSD